MAKGRIEANDIISKEALASVDLLGSKLKMSLDNVDALIAKGKGIDKAFSGSVTMKDLNQIIRDQITNYKELDTEKKNAEKVNDDLKVSQSELIKTNEREKQGRKELTDTLKAQSVLENKEAGTLEKLVAQNKLLTLEKKKLNLETEAGRKRLIEINAQLDENTATMRENADAATKQRMNIGNYQSALEGLPGPLGGVASSAKMAGNSLKALSKIPLLAVVLAIIAAFAGLVKIFKSTEEGGDRIGKLMGKIKGILSVLKQAAQEVSLALADLFSGRFRQAAEHLKEGFSGIGGRMAAAAESGGKLYDALDRIGSEKLAYNIDAVREKIAQLRADAAETADETKKAKLLKEAIALTEEMYSKEIDWSKRTAEATLSDMAIKYGMSAEELKAYTLLSYEERLKAEANDQKLADFANKLNDEGIAKLKDTITEENKLRSEANLETLRFRKTITSSEDIAQKEAAAAKKKRIDEERKTFEEDAKLTSQVIAEMAEEDKKTLEDNAKAKLDGFAKSRDEELSVLNDSFLKGEKSTEEYEREKLNITNKYEDLILKSQLNTIKETIANSVLSIAQKTEFEAKAAEIEKQITDNSVKQKIDAQTIWDEVYNEELDIELEAYKELKTEQAKIDKESDDKKREQIQALWDLSNEVGNAIFEINNNRINAEIEAIEKKRDKEIEAAGDSKEAQARINAKYDRLVAEQKTKQAKNDKLAALFNIAINTAEGLVRYGAEGNWIMFAIMAALGSIQAGVVASQKIPEFRLGTKNSPGGPAYVGEEGRELMIDTYGGVQFTPERKSLVYLKPHTQIVPAKETDLLLRQGLQVGRDSQKQEVNIDLEPVIKAIKNKREYIFNFRDEGIDITERRGDWYVNYKNNFRI